MSGAFDEHFEQAKAHATKILSGVADAAMAAGVTCETVQIEHTHPYKAIIETAKERSCLGSVTNKVLTHTNVPVLVYH